MHGAGVVAHGQEEKMEIGNTANICQRCYHAPCVCSTAIWPWQSVPWPVPATPYPGLCYMPSVCPLCWGYGMRYDAAVAKTLECECGALAIHKKYTAAGK